MKKVTVILMVAVALFSSAICSAAEYMVVVNSGNPLTQISKGELRNIYLGKKTTWDRGQKIELAVLGGGKAHEEFCREVVNKTHAQFGNFWKTALFTGTGTPPKSLAGDAAMLGFVKNNPDAIGYISGNTAPSGVKILGVD
jgi:ABC-type phosphate transport system substrate-binding protein